MGDCDLELAYVNLVSAQFARVVRSDLAASLFRSIASRLSNVAEDTARLDERSISRLALQNPWRSSNAGRTDSLYKSRHRPTWPGATLNHVARTQAPSPER